jgi:hypothetical protein
MKRTQGPEPGVTGTQQAINSLAVTVGGIYLATHSVIVTVIAATASTLLTACSLPGPCGWGIIHATRWPGGG